MKKIFMMLCSFLLILLISGCSITGFIIGKPKEKDPVACRKHSDCKSDADYFNFCFDPNTTEAKCDVQKCIVKDDCEAICKEWTIERAGDIMACKARRVKCKSDQTCLCSCLIRASDIKND